MTTARASALNQIIELSIEERILSIADVQESIDDAPSRRSIRRALEDAEEYGWVTKQSRHADNWMAGDVARKYQPSDFTAGYPTTELPIMYFAVNSAVPKDFLDGENILASAGLAWREAGAGFTMGIPDANHLIIDSGGYQAASYFQTEYPYSPKELHDWASSINADVVWGMDWACEDASVLSDNTGVPESDIKDWEWRLEKSWTDQVAQYDYYEGEGYDHEFRPVIQGHDPHHFKEFAQTLKDSHLPDDYIGIGTVCKRSSKDEILDVVTSVREVLPDSQIHLFGATLNIWKDEAFRGLFESSDSAAWIQHDPDSGMFADDLERAYNEYRRKIDESALGQ